jgi:hypothetical protein
MTSDREREREKKNTGRGGCALRELYRIYTKEWCGINSLLVETAPFFCVCPVLIIIIVGGWGIGINLMLLTFPDSDRSSFW